jgi:LCP family protein required for cell wall assembly
MTAVREVPGVLALASGTNEGPPADPAGRPRRKRRGTRIMVALLAVLLLVTGGAIITLLSLQSHLAGQVDRFDGAFEGLDNRPQRAGGAAAKSMNILVMGTDRRSAEQTTGSAATAADWVPGAQRTDTIMILHINADRDGASLVSIPRDSWVDVPGHGHNKINAAFSLAGPSLAVETVENLTGVRIDHLAVIDWEGYRSLIDSVGGVDIRVPRTVEDPHNDVVWTKGKHHLNGEQALTYARQRYGLTMGDIDRVKRQQAVLRSLMRSSLATLGSASPSGIYDLLDTLTQNISVDAGWEFGDMRSLVMDMRGVRPADMHFLTAPVAAFGREGAQSVVYLDKVDNDSMWEAVKEDKVAGWAKSHPLDVLSGPAL